MEVEGGVEEPLVRSRCPSLYSHITVPRVVDGPTRYGRAPCLQPTLLLEGRDQDFRQGSSEVETTPSG